MDSSAEVTETAAKPHAGPSRTIISIKSQSNLIFANNLDVTFQPTDTYIHLRLLQKNCF